VLSQLAGGDPIPKGMMNFLSARAQNKFFDYVHAKLREAEKAGLKRSDLARRIGKTPSRLSHVLAEPGNWTIDTVTELLIGICNEEIEPASRSVLGRPPRNIGPVEVWAESAEADSTPYAVKFEGMDAPSPTPSDADLLVN
jgi:hypothetical protein